MTKWQNESQPFFCVETVDRLNQTQITKILVQSDPKPKPKVRAYRNRKFLITSRDLKAQKTFKKPMEIKNNNYLICWHSSFSEMASNMMVLRRLQLGRSTTRHSQFGVRQATTAWLESFATLTTVCIQNWKIFRFIFTKTN